MAVDALVTYDELGGTYSFDDFRTYDSPLPTGVPFRPDAYGVEARLIVEVAPNADQSTPIGTWPWLDVTPFVYWAPSITVKPGRPDESSQAPAASCNFTLLSQDGAFNPYLPTSIYFPGFDVGMPVRVRLDPGPTYGTGAITFFRGKAYSLAPTWDETGHLSTVVIQANGVKRQLGNFRDPLHSPLYRTSSALPGLVCYWSMEDVSGSTRFAAVTNDAPLVGVSPTAATFASAGPAGSLPVGNFAAAVNAGGCVYTTPVNATARGLSTWCVNVVYRVRNLTSHTTPLLTFTTDGRGGSTYQLQYRPVAAVGIAAGCYVELVNTDYSLGVQSTDNFTGPEDGGWHLLQCAFTQIGSDVCFFLLSDGVAVTNSNLFTGTTLGHLTSISVGKDNIDSGGISYGFNVDIGHVSVCSMAAFPFNHSDIKLPNSAALTASVSGYTGETVSARLTRLASELGLSLTQYGTETQPMGPQAIDTPLGVLQTCESTGQGALYDGFDADLVYVSRAARYNATAKLTVAVASDQLVAPFAPTVDDQRFANDVTATSPTGSARALDTTSRRSTTKIGNFTGSINATPASNTGTAGGSGLQDYAGWGIHLGGYQGMRYPGIGLDLVKNPAQIVAFAGQPLAWRLDLTAVNTNLVQHPPDPVALIVEGYQVKINPLELRFELACVPQQPWRVAVLDDAVLGRLDTDGSTITTAITSGATSFAVATPSGVLWTTTATRPTDFPFDIVCEGERMTVTAIVGATSPQTFTVTRSVNGVIKAHAINAPINVWQPMVLAL